MKGINGAVKWGATILPIVVAFAVLVSFAANTNYKASQSCERISDHEARLRVMETTLPRIDERLANIERLLIRREREYESAKVQPRKTEN